MSATEFTLENILSIATIRTHTKTDDVPHVTDEQLALYRKAAFEACEHYTGNLYSCKRTITENIGIFKRADRAGRTMKATLAYTPSDGIVYYNIKGERGIVHTETGSRTIRIPAINVRVEGNCCIVCETEGNYGATISYAAGYDGFDKIPAGILVGVLKWIAWSIEHEGSQLVTMANSGVVRGQAIQGTNDTTWASGALALWREYVSDGI